MRLHLILLLTLLLLIFGCLQNQHSQNEDSSLSGQNLYFYLIAEDATYLINLTKSDLSASVYEIGGPDLSYVTFVGNGLAYGVDLGTLKIINISNPRNPKIVGKFKVEPVSAKVYPFNDKILLMDGDLNLYIYKGNRLIKKMHVGYSLPGCDPNFYCISSFVVTNGVLYAINERSEDKLDEGGYIREYYMSKVDLNTYSINQFYKDVYKVGVDYGTIAVNVIDGNIYMSGVSSDGPLLMLDLNGNILQEKILDETAFKIEKVGHSILLEGFNNCYVYNNFNEVYSFRCNFLSTESDGSYVYSISTDESGKLFLDVYNETGIVKSINLGLNSYDIGGYQLLLLN